MSKSSPNSKPKPPIKKKYIETPEKMWQLFMDYKTSIKSKPILEHDFVGKDGVSDYRKRERCLTFEGFQNYLDDQEVITDVTDYFENKDKRYSAYIRVCSRVKRVIRQDQIEGGMAGIYNASITQRLNGLADKSTVTVTEQPLFPDVKN